MKLVKIKQTHFFIYNRNKTIFERIIFKYNSIDDIYAINVLDIGDYYYPIMLNIKFFGQQRG